MTSNSGIINLHRKIISNDPRHPLPEFITVYHSTPVRNLASILKWGITLNKFDFEKKLIIINNSKVSEQKKENARRRLMEAFDENLDGIVCCSGDKNYSIQNGHATDEWRFFIDGKNYYEGELAVFTIKIPMKILEILTPKNSIGVIQRFEDLWEKGYFARKSWESRVHGYGMNNPIKSYDHILLQYLPPEYIESYEIIEK